ncbi:MAG: pyridoxal phosphate-dependent aminotransferase [Flavobacteriaceae bacterium]|nr:pyridoxal phosphate-dependent aminotransferase [Flavobacteriaceae bacterium]
MYRKVDQSQTLFINSQTERMVSQKRDVFRFGFGQSPFMPPQYIQEALKKAVIHKEYSSVQGDLELRENIANFHFMHNGLKVKTDNVVVAPGSKILIFNILMTFENADVFIPAPAWVSYGPQAKLAGHHIIKIPTSFEQRWRITPQSIHDAARTKRYDSSILILNYPGNPDGLTYSEEELSELSIAAGKYNMLVISDEIYGLLDHDNTHHSFASYYPQRTITTTGLSKWCGAGGWRFGAAMISDGLEPSFRKTLVGIGSETYSCAPVPVQIAARDAYQDYEMIKPYIDKQLGILKMIGNYCCEELKKVNINVHPPQGGFYLFLDFSLIRERLNSRGIRTSFELCDQLLSDTGVVLLPSTAFGFEDDFLGARLAYVDFDEPEEGEVLNLRSHFPRITRGIEALCKWMSEM